MTMNFEEALSYCRENFAEILRLAKTPNGKKYICPVCGQGAHKNNGLVQGTRNRARYMCPVCDGFNSDPEAGGDIFDWACRMQGFRQNSRECYLWVFEQAGISVQGFNEQRTPTSTSKKEKAPANTTKAQTPTEPQADYMELYKRANENVANTDYFKRRGLNEEAIKYFMLGYIENWRHPKAVAEGKRVPPSPRAIIPVGPSCYLARDTRRDADIPEQNRGFIKQKVGDGKALFNVKRALEHPSNTIIVTEGELDAVSIWQAGGNPLGLRSVTNKDVIIELIKKHPEKKWILALDNDKDGKKTSKEIVNQIAKAQRENPGKEYQVYIINLYHKTKDANEALQLNFAFLRTTVQEAMNNPEGMEYRGTSDAVALRGYYDEILDPERGKCYPTGFRELDKELGGGLYSGLYTLGAISSLGKTTFILQIENNLAKQGQDVLFFSLEMSRNELIAKSISKFTALKSLEKNGNTDNASTQRQVMSGYLYKKYTNEQRETLFEACKEYEQISTHIYTIEGNFDYTVQDIQARVKKHIKATGKKPVVFVDYLQILGLDDEIPDKSKGRPRNYTDKQKADRIVSTLKRMSRDLDVPVIVVSSFNRESYTQPVSMASFKESGGIEYSCDVLIGLQYMGMDYDSDKDGDPEGGGKKKGNRYKRIMELIAKINENVKEGGPAPVQCKLLKNRNGARGQSVYFQFFPRYNLYTEMGRESQIFAEYQKLGRDNFDGPAEGTALDWDAEISKDK